MQGYRLKKLPADSKRGVEILLANTEHDIDSKARQVPGETSRSHKAMAVQA